MHLQKNIYDDLDLDLVVKVTRSHKMLSSTLQIMTYAPAKFEDTTSNSIGEDGFTRKNIL